MTLVPVVDDAACALHGDCADLVPDVFDVSGDVAVVVSTSGPDDRVLEAARSCPAGAISVYDDAGALVYP